MRNMEDEVDVDIEGDEFENNIRDPEVGVLAPERFIRSEWTSSAAILPWQLDSSISSEDREAIKTMLLEEQYYLTGGGTPDHLWESEADNCPKGTKSPTKAPSSGSSTRWSPQEKDLFEEGLAQFGRRWTKISKLVGSRSAFQVKSYARQFFKRQTPSEPRGAAPPAGGVLQLHPQSTSAQASAPSNAVRIETLSDEEDEEVDITDDPSEEGGVKAGLREPVGGATPADAPEEPGATEAKHRHTSLPPPSSPPPPTETGPEDEEPPPPRKAETTAQRDSEETAHEDTRETLLPRPLPAEALLNSHGPLCSTAEETEQSAADGAEEEEDQEEEEEEEEEEELLKVPEKEMEMDMETIAEEEKQAIPEFFEGRPSKTPERYLKIRNYILDQLRIKPRYLNKTSVRPGLKNCGDVNCIGRIHTYLELVGAINFHCEQAVYNRPGPVDRSKHREGRDVMEAYQLAQRLQSMRTRKRRVRDTWGNWCDSRDLEGQTYEHLSAEELALRREERKRNPKPCKMSRLRGSFDPFQLIPCRCFGEDVQEPFQVIVCAETLLIMDMHAHVSRCEVIGLLGGAYDEEKRVLKIRAAEPCNSVSTGLQCEMDPVSQTQAHDLLSSLGLCVVGWYHSHPSFHPNPSVRDINTQDQFQSYFSRGGAPFIGMIVSPYDPASPSPHSQTTCLQVRGSQEPSGPQKLPYRFDFLSSQDIPDWEQTLRRARWIIHRYHQAAGRVQMDGLFRRDSHLTCLEKMLSSLARYLEPLPDEEGDSFLTEIQASFQAHFMAPQDAIGPAHSEEFSFDGLVGEEGGEGGGDGSGPDSSDASSAVLHLGSVLSTEYDYLL
ncbi:histone H2A deubiquitinase MYSM1 isoform X2 [Pungitius pungitius]|uniref:histone H2A deubiquitinase MYSM1 isoform X2 n=1 Tax=Pungitius pungitius TaxID=134920 RepID=UPI002E0EDC16